MRHAAMVLGLVSLSLAGAAQERERMGVPVVHPDFPLAPCAIVHPDSEVGRREAERIAEAVGKLGGAAKLLTPGQALDETGLRLRPEIASASHVLLGDINTNRALIPYYADLLDFTDAYTPGQEGYVLRVVPRGVGAGGDALIVGASTDAALAAGTDRLLALLGQCAGPSLPYVFEARLTGGMADALSGPAWNEPFDPARWANTDYTEMATLPGYLYAVSARPVLAERVVSGLLKGARQGEWYPVSDYTLEWLTRAWVYVRDAPCVTPEDAALIDNAFLRTLYEDQGQYWRARDGSHIGSRHQTMGTSAFYTAVRLLLRRGAPDAAARKQLEAWRGECEAYFANAAKAFHDDFEGIPTYHSFQPIANEALRSGTASYFGENLDWAVQRALAVTDNVGYYAGTGTYEEARPGTTRQPIMLAYPLQMAAFLRQDGGYEWLLRHFAPDSGTWGYVSSFGGHRFARPRNVPEEEPRHLLGLLVVPLGPYRERAIPAGARHFEKLCFRDSFDRQGQYLVLEGYQASGADNVPPRDANSIIRYTDLGHIWLYANTERSGNFHRNAVYVSDGLNETWGEPACELAATRDAGSVALAASRLRGYVAGDWTRNIIWRKGRYFVVIDVLDHSWEGEHSATCTFRTPCPAEATESGMRAWECEAEMRVVSADGLPHSVRRSPAADGAAIPTFLRQTQTFPPGAGERVVFRNLVYATDPSRPLKLDVRPAGRWAVLLHGETPDGEELALAGVCPPGETVKIGPLRTSASLFFVSPETIVVEGGAVLLRGRALAATGGGDALRSALRRLWKAAGPARAQSATEAPGTSARRLVQFSAFTPRPEAILGPDIRAEPIPTSGTVYDLIDGTIPLWQGVGFPGGTDIRLTFDLRRRERLDSIELAAGLVAGVNVLPDRASPPPARPAAVRLDGGPEQMVQFEQGHTFEPLHKGCVCAMTRWRAALGGGEAQRVELLLPKEAWSGGGGVREVVLRRRATNEARPILVRQADVNGDGAPELILAADTGEVLCLDGAGGELWRRMLPGPITALECLDLGDGPPAVLAATREARLYRLSPTGEVAWTASFLPLAQENGDLPTAYSIGTWTTGEGKREIVCGNYNAVSFVSADGKRVEYCRANGAFETMLLREAMDLTGDGIEDQLAFNVWSSLSVIDGAQRRMTAGRAAPQGEGLCFEWWDTDRGKPLLVVAAENGVGLMDARSGEYVWRRDVSPLSGCVIADLRGEVGRVVAVAKRDGFLLLYSAAGDLVGRVMLGEPIECLAAVPEADGRARLVIATERRIVLLDANLTSTTTLAEGSASRLLPLRDPGAFAVLRPQALVEVLALP